MLRTYFSHLRQSARLRKTAVWGLATLVLFLGFLFNVWRVAEPQWFQTHQRDTESLIIGRMVQSRQAGIFSVGGLTGAGMTTDIQQGWITTDQIENQYAAYLNSGTFAEFSPYLSQPGGQGILFSLLDASLPLSPQTKLWGFYVLTALLSAVALTAIVRWFSAEFGGWVGLCVAASAVLSQWLTVFGRNLWWSLWAFYLPMLVGMVYLQRHNLPTNRQFITLGLLIFGAVSVKCFINGYEYITTTLLMMLTPCVYYAIRDRWDSRRCLKGVSAAIAGSGLAIALSLLMLCVQIGAAKGGFMDGVGHVVYSLGKRTHGEAEGFPPIYAASLEAETLSVVVTYMRGVFFDLNTYLPVSTPFVSEVLWQVRYFDLIVLFLIASGLLLWRRRGGSGSREAVALIAATWFSVSAPLSWYVIFKAHSYIHTHMSFLLWQMPFTFFGFAVLGAWLSGKRGEFSKSGNAINGGSPDDAEGR